jgi:hypothetical protein
MLGFLKPRGELVEISGRTVVFISAKPYKMDQKFEVKLGLPEPAGQTISVAVRVLSCRSGPGDFFVVVGIAEGRREPPNLKGYQIRNHPRAPHRITVKSEGLPSYRAVTKDLGRGGFGAELDGELPEDKVLNVHFEFDEPLGWTLDLRARVAWSIWKSQNRYDTGFAFLEDPLYALPLEQLAAWLDHREKHELIPFKPPDRLPPRRPNELPNQLPQAHQMPPPAQGNPMPYSDPGQGHSMPVGHQFPHTEPGQQMPASQGPSGQHPGHPPMPGQQAPEQFALSEAQRAASGISSYDDDPTPLGLPTLVQPPPRPISLKLPTLPQTVALERPSAFQLPPPVVPASEGSGLLPKAAPAATERPASLPADAPSLEDLGVRIHFHANLRGWAWEGADDSVVVVLEDIHGTDHWLEFPGCRGMQGRCRHREMALLGMAVAHSSAMIDELTRDDAQEALLHYRFYDDRQRVVLDIVAKECREQIR